MRVGESPVYLPKCMWVVLCAVLLYFILKWGGRGGRTGTSGSAPSLRFAAMPTRRRFALCLAQAAAVDC
eukprot:scaffold76412_cov31-Tisochrysis_lutea.AAC.4